MFFFNKHNLFYSISCIVLIISSMISKEVYAQNVEHNAKELFNISFELWNKGDFEEAEKMLDIIIKKQESIESKNLIAVFNLYGLINKYTGNYTKAVYFYKKASNLCFKLFEADHIRLVKIFYNTANVYKDIGDYDKAMMYYEQAAGLIHKSSKREKDKMYELTKIYYNIGILKFIQKKYNEALQYYNKSILIREKYKFKGTENIYQNIARCYFETGDFQKSETFFLKSIKKGIKEFGNESYKLAPYYLHYGEFLCRTERPDSASKYIEKSVQIYLKTYGKKHPFTANAYVYLGDLLLSQNKIERALYYYQKSLIANSPGFNSLNIYDNPEFEDVFSPLQLLKGLKKKVTALQTASNETDIIFQKKEYLENSLNTVNTALELVAFLRLHYLSPESKFDITKEEKICYSMALKSSAELYELTGSDDYTDKSYYYVMNSKASVLEEQLYFKKLLLQNVDPGIRKQKENIEQKTDQYKKMIYIENEKLHPNNKKIVFWKSKLFDLANDQEEIINKIKKEYPSYKENFFSDKIFTVKSVQNQLKKDDAVVEYFISAEYGNETPVLYTFVIKKDDFIYNVSEPGSRFNEKIHFVKTVINETELIAYDLDKYNKLNKTLFELYSVLIMPIKNEIKDFNIIIIPDEDISYVSFDALISKDITGSKINYSELPFLIYDYSFSYAYSSSLLFKEKYEQSGNYIMGFAPEYNGGDQNLTRHEFGKLTGAKNEIEAIMKWFDGDRIIGTDANKTKFEELSQTGSILHFAMHASVEEDNPDFSYLAFSKHNEKDINTGILYNYEIDRMNINSPMVVLSACNTGDGKFYSGEGVMSLTRSFIHAGVRSVVHTLWSVNDQSGMKIMDKFYKYLSEGYTKSEALRQAKLDFIKNASPTVVNPYYWAGYVITGDNVPVKKSNTIIYYLLLTGFILISAVLFFRLRKRKRNNRLLSLNQIDAD